MDFSRKINMKNLEIGIKSLKGLWIGDCIGNIGQLYFAHDILKALDEGLAKFGKDNINPMGNSFQYSDDTEEAIVLFNHINNFGDVKQDFLARELAIRYYDRDPDGEIYGYGLMTRTVLKEIYDGKSWREANQTKPRIEGPSHVDNLLSNIADGKSITDSMTLMNIELKKKMEKEPLKVGSCGNGSAMRVPPLGAYFFGKSVYDVKTMARLQSEVTHCHPEGIAGSIAIALLSKYISLLSEWENYDPSSLFNLLLEDVPRGQVWDGIKKASELPFDTPLTKLMEVLGNGTYVTCQDTVPLCVFLTIRALCQYKVEEMYEKVIIETCMCFGDVDTNCAIVGGMIGIISAPPERWVRYCQPMEGVLGEPLPEKKLSVKNSIKKKLAMDLDVNEILNCTRPWSTGEGMVEDQADAIFEKEKVLASALRTPAPTWEEVLAARKRDLKMV